MQRKHSILSVLTLGLVVLTACAPGQPAQIGETTGRVAAPEKEKTVTVVMNREMTTFDEVISGAQGNAAWRHWVEFAHEPLTVANRVPGGPEELRLAAEIPTQQNGKWVIRPDGTMDMTWKIVPNARWHDGTPVTAEDIAFTVRLRNDPAVKRQTLGGGIQYISDVTVLDPYTFTTHWKQPSTLGRNGTGLDPLPKHLWEPVYKEDPSQLQYSTLNSRDYVGAGPFKLASYEPAQYIEFRRFDEYYKGPAKVHRVFLKTIYDANAMAANLLAGAADVLLPPAIGMEEAAELGGRGAQVMVGQRTGANQYELQRDLTYARPVNFVNPLVRQAGLIAINREELAAEMTLGQGKAARVNDHPTDDYYKLLKDWIEAPDFPYIYPYDPRKAVQLLEQAGWMPGPDGVRVHQPSGERFDYEVQIRPGTAFLKQNSIIQQDLKAVGINLQLHVFTATEENDNKFVSTKTGATNVTAGPKIGARRFHSSNIATEANNWTGGNNRGRYNDPAMDRLIEATEKAVLDTELRDLGRQFLDRIMGEVAFWPFYYEPIPWMMVKGVTGVFPAGGNQGWWWELDKN
ncbi:MAG: hypothetical protein HY534_07355 [Chloroflexi bacterium]|nr:hypothetical protein [Chloroflexota bacterium]